ncbi:MAG: cyclodeaminase/cyclohydrolase family protein [Phascolarctobacterium sp.]|nr:cyclodeaminase/cyclohydrolase family protein [Phascolarctobacterium sp.]
MSKLTDMKSTEFLAALASSAPAPGGGGGAAMAGALAASLASMVANLTIGKEKFAQQEPEVKELLDEAEEVRQTLLTLVEDDAAVFNSFMACYKLPKATEEEKAARTAAIRNAAKEAAEVPLAIARASYRALMLAERLVCIGNPGVITDGACSALLARAALRCAEYNVRINLGLTKDEEYNRQVKAELNNLLKTAEELEEEALAVTDKVLG